MIRLALFLIRLASIVVPRRDRRAWLQEWEAEVLHRERTLRREEGRNWSARASLTRRAAGSFVDAAWLRRQFTRDSELVHDVRHGLRLMRHRPGFFGLAIVVMALGIGSTTAVWNVAETLLLKRLPYPAAEELVAVWQHDTQDAASLRGEVAAANFLDWRAGTTTFATLAAADPYSMDYTGGSEPIVFFGARITEGFFDLLRVRPLHGRLFQAGDYLTGRNTVVVLGHGLWQRHFGADPAIVGRTIPLDGVPHTVVGVLPASVELNLLPAPGDRDLWLPKVFQDFEKTARGSGWWAVIGRMASGTTIDRAQADLDLVSARLAREFPRTNASIKARVEPLGDHIVGDAKPALALLLGAVLIVLLVACANVANMMLARAADREREFLMRVALGAGRARLVRQVLIESALIAFAGAGLGVIVALWLLDAVVALAPREIPRLATVGIDLSTLAVTVVAALAAALLAGFVPAIQFSRPRRLEAGALDPARGGTMSRRSRLFGDGLAVVEIALAVALVVSAGLLLRSFTRLIHVYPGFRGEQVLALQVFAWDRQDTPEKRAAFFVDTIQGLRTLPGVTEAGAVSAMPFIEANINIQGPFAIEGRPPVDARDQPRVALTTATPGYFRTMGIPLVRGRLLAESDTATSAAVVVVSSAFARRHWPDGDPLGSWVRFRFAGPDVRRAQVVGVVGDLRHDALDRPAREEIFLPHSQAPYGSMTYVIRTAGDPAALIDPAKRLIWSRDPLLTFYDTATVSQLLAASVAPRRFSLVLIGVFAVTALVLAGAGIYGVLSYTTGRQTREFGVRLALGASKQELGRLVIGRGLRLGTIGLTVGLATALLAGGSMRAVLFEVSPFDPLTIGAVSAGVLLIAVGACYVPARRAMRTDPVVALRGD
jgi:putative ABC transport system permease protein